MAQINEFSSNVKIEEFPGNPSRLVYKEPKSGFRDAYPDSNIPDIIKTAIRKEHKVQISSLTSPTGNTKAILCRQIGDYSLLAIATKEFEEDYPRAFTGYRYFWLEAPFQGAVEGIITLINWWLKSDQPSFVPEPIQPEQSYFAQPVYAENFKRTQLDSLIDSLNLLEMVEKSGGYSLCILC